MRDLSECLWNVLLVPTSLGALAWDIMGLVGFRFYDHAGQAHEVAQAEGGEQGDPLMPGLFAVGIHPALLAAHAELGPRADLYAFLDDTYVACDPADACDAFVTLRSALKRHANIDVHLGKTRVWNSTGEQPPGLTEVLPTAPGEAPVWVGDHSVPLQQQGFLVLGTPFGSEAFKKEALRTKGLSHGRLLDRIPSLPDRQSAWLLLLMCAAPRSNYLLRSLAPSLTDEFARTHDDGITRCLADLLANDAPIHIDDLGRRRAALPLKLGGLGLRRAQEGRDAAYWASWADTLPILHQHHPSVVAEVLRRVQSASLEGPDEATPNLAELAKAARGCRKPGSRCLPGMHLPMTGARLLRLLSAPLESRCEDGSEPPRPAWTPPLARAFFLTLTRLRER